MPIIPCITSEFEAGNTCGRVRGSDFPFTGFLLRPRRTRVRPGHPLILNTFLLSGPPRANPVSRSNTRPHQKPALSEADSVVVQTDLEAMPSPSGEIARSSIVKLGMAVEHAELLASIPNRLRVHACVSTPSRKVSATSLPTTINKGTKTCYLLCQAQLRSRHAIRFTFSLLAGPARASKSFARSFPQTLLAGYIPPRADGARGEA